MKMMSRERVQLIKETYPEGTKVECIRMDDPYNPVPSGTKGVVTCVDSIGQIHVDWENGSSLALVPGVDIYKKV